MTQKLLFGCTFNLNMASGQALPKDIYNCLALVLDLSTLSKFSRTSKDMYLMCSSETFWQKKFETQFGQRMWPLHSWRLSYKLQLKPVLKGTLTVDDDDPIACDYRINLTDLDSFIDHDGDDNKREFVNFYCDMFIRLIGQHGKPLCREYQDKLTFKEIKTNIFKPYFKFYDDIDEGGMMFQTDKRSIGGHSFDRNTTYEFQIGSKLYQEVVNVFRRD